MEKVLYLEKLSPTSTLQSPAWQKLLTLWQKIKIDTLIINTPALALEEIQSLFPQAEIVHDQEMSQVGMNYYWVHDIAKNLCQNLKSIAFDLDFGIKQIIFSAQGAIVGSIDINPNHPHHTFAVLEEIPDTTVFNHFTQTQKNLGIFKQETPNIDQALETQQWIPIQ